MSKYAVMPYEDYTAICDSLRSKTGDTSELKSRDIISAVDGLTSGNAWVNIIERNAQVDFIIPSGVTKIGDYAFAYWGTLGNVTIPDGVTSIGTYAFFYCTSLTSVTIPDSVTSIGVAAFYEAKAIESMVIPEGVTILKRRTFQGCRKLRSITLPSTLATIEDYAFSVCLELMEITCLAETPPQVLSSYGLYNFPKDCVIYVPKGCGNAYKNATNWSARADYIQEIST